MYGFLPAAIACLIGMCPATPAAAGTISVDINDPSCVSGSGQPDPYSVVYCAIEDAVADSVNGDVVEVAAGIYIPAGNRLVIDRQITVTADPALGVSGPGPQLRPEIIIDYFSYSNCGIQIAADNVIFDGFDVTGVYGSGRYLVGDYGGPVNNWIVRNCDIHDTGHCIVPCGSNALIEYNNLHETRGDCINGEYGNCYGITIRHNWLHSHHTDSGSKPAGFTFNCSSTNTDPVEITYNYCWASRTFVDFQNNGGTAPAGNILVAHNTVDWWIGDLPSPPQAGDLAQQMSVAWWTGTANFWNGPNFEIRDNLFTRQKWYQVVVTDLQLQGQITLENCLFDDWYLVDAYYPAYATDFEWPGTRGAVGWDDMGAGNEFIMSGCLTGDPLYAAAGTTPDTYYALSGSGSPAYQTATDGTNIGAWQGIFEPTPTPTPTITPTPTVTPTSGPPTETPVPPPLPAGSPAGMILLLVVMAGLIGVSIRR